MRWFLLFIGVLAAAWWLLDSIAANPGSATITWGQWLLEMQSATLLLAVILSCVVFYFCVRGVLNLLGLPQRLARARDRKLSTKAAQSLTQGLVQLSEGHWEKAQALLTQDVQYSETPLLNYLTAARAAHMQEKPEQRDELLRYAIASDNSAQVAVGVSRAEMQLADAQLEQAHATLVNLRTIAPQNRYVLKLYAKALFRQESWEQLFALLPELQRHDLLENDSRNMRRIKAATLSGMFTRYANSKQIDQLQQLWEKIPAEISAQPESKRLYADALYKAGADKVCAEFIVYSNAQARDEQLTGLYGKLQHDNADLAQAITQARAWLDTQPDNPVNLLLMGRLYQRQQDYDKAGFYYMSSLNQAPEAEAYLELAGMLEMQGKYDHAGRCCRIGLHYAIHGKGERLTLGGEGRPPLQVAG